MRRGRVPRHHLPRAHARLRLGVRRPAQQPAALRRVQRRLPLGLAAVLHRRRLAPVAALVGALLASPVAGAQTDATAEARARFDRGVALFEAGDARGALAEFQRAYDLSQRPSLLFNLAATHQSLHEYPEAIDALRRFLTANAHTHARQRRDAERALRELEALVARLRVQRDPPDATVTLDGRPLAGDEALVGPGAHTLDATAPGRVALRVEVTVASGDTRAVRLALVAEPVRSAVARAVTAVVAAPVVAPAVAPLVAPSGRPWLWATIATGGALALGASITGVLAVQNHGDFLSRAASDPEVDALARRGRALSIAADVMAVGAVAAGAAAVVIAVRGTTSTQWVRAVALPVSGGAWAGVGGAF
jgi:hypothetical protein